MCPVIIIDYELRNYLKYVTVDAFLSLPDGGEPTMLPPITTGETKHFKGSPSYAMMI
jgi:hypothetical protein